MVDDHTPVDAQLTSLATSKGVTPPTTLSDADQAALTKLGTLHGRLFDMTYLRGQVAGHQQMVTILQNEIANGTDADLKAFAQSVLPTVQQHLAMARRLAGIRVPKAKS